jgi:hypothetical protein
MAIGLKRMESPEDIRAFRAFGSDALEALVVFRKDSSRLRTPAEAEKGMLWLQQALGDKWGESIVPRNRSDLSADDPAYRIKMIPAILKEATFGAGSIDCDDAFVAGHAFYEFETWIEGKAYFCVAVFRK